MPNWRPRHWVSKSHLLPIEPAFQAFLQVLQPVFAGLPPDITEENIQARCRGVLLMAISNKTGKLVLTTGNKSETAVGYSTLYGDMAGGFAPIKDVLKTMVYRLAAWRNRQSPVIPQRVFDRPPSAELRPDQTDQDSLPPYEVLDAILHGYVEEDRSVEELIAGGFRPGDGGAGGAAGDSQRVQTPAGRAGRAHHPARLRPRSALSDHLGISPLAGQRRRQMRLHLL